MKNKNENLVKKSFISTIIFVFIVIIVFYFIFKENNYKEIYHILNNSNKLYLLLALICMSFFSVFEALNIRTALRLFKYKISFKQCYKYALAGFFVAGITPSSTGGDPMQLYLMSKDDVNISHGALVLLLKLLSFQITVVFLSIIGFIYSHNIFMESLGGLKYIIFIGAFLNILVGTLYFFIIFFKPVITSIVDLFAKLLFKLHLKKANSIIDKINKLVEDYGKASVYIVKNKKILIRIFLTTLTQMILYYCIPYFVYLALGFNDHSIFTFLSLQAVLFVSVSSLPFPGAVGVSEATFMRIYSTMFPKIILGSAMVITRFINFYIFIFYSGIAFLYFIIKGNHLKR